MMVSQILPISWLLIIFTSATEAAIDIDLKILSNELPFNLFQNEQFTEIWNKKQIYFNKNQLPNYRYMLDSLKQFENGPSVTIPRLGTARGRELNSISGYKFFSFNSIPYAKPPIGKLRFKMPVLYEGKWPVDFNGEEYDATYFRSKCPQISLLTGRPSGKEDCLHLNIYTPANFTLTNLLPVMFFIHGGAFLNGDASLYVPTKLMDRQVVVVVVQYRLGSLGFLAAQTPQNPGNMGLMDQITALRWVQKYISYFGGDPNLVTVFGQSAGSVSTSWMQFTPATTADRNNGNQLLHRVIMQSGSALDVWGHDREYEASFRLQALAVDCWIEGDQDPVTEALDCMRKKSVYEIVEGFNSVYLNDRLSGGLGFKGSAPVIQKNLIKNYRSAIEKDPDLVVLPEEPFKLLKSGNFLRVPVIAGAVRDEGSVFLGYIYDQYLVPNGLTTNTTFLSQMFIPIIISDLEIPDTSNVIANSMKLSFFEDLLLGNFTEMSGGLVDMIGMVFLKSGVWQMAHMQTIKNDQDGFYFYSFEFESDNSLFDWFFINDPNLPIEGGIGHGDELLYFFALPGIMNEYERRMMDRLTTYWVNFAQYGNPAPNGNTHNDRSNDFKPDWARNKTSVPEWQSFTIENLKYLLMDRNLTMKTDYSTRWNYNSKSELLS